MSNKDAFRSALVTELTSLFVSDSTYSFVKRHTSPEALADKFIAGLSDGSADKDGLAVKRACAALKVPHTYTAIQSFLAS